MEIVSFEASTSGRKRKRPRKRQEKNPSDVDCYLLELTLKSSFTEWKKGVLLRAHEDLPQKPIFSIHSMNPAKFIKKGQKVNFRCNYIKNPRPRNFSVTNYPEMVIYWPNITGALNTYFGFWWFQKEKHGSMALFPGDFLDTTLELGKRYIKEIQKFMVEEGYGRGGIFNCKAFQDRLNARFGFKMTAVFGREEMPSIVKLTKIEILLNEDLRSMDHQRDQKLDLKKLSFELKIPDLVDEADFPL